MRAGEAPPRVVVTGGGSGIGRAVAAAFAGRGARVAILGRNAGRLSAAARELGPQVVWLQADVSRRDDVSAATQAVVEAFGGVDVLVNNAGFVPGGHH